MPLAGCKLLRTAPSYDSSKAGECSAFETLAVRTAAFLLENQVIASSQTVSLQKIGRSRYAGWLEAYSTRAKPERHRIRLVARRRRHGWQVFGQGRIRPAVLLHAGSFFRVTDDGEIEIAGSEGIRPEADRAQDRRSRAASTSLASLVKQSIKRIGWLARTLRSLRSLLPQPPPSELSNFGGITWRLTGIDTHPHQIHVEAYDRGGIYDRHLNAEGQTFPPQVPGNYYADAYSAYVFGWLYRRTGKREWLDGSLNALEFAWRVYPQYRPASIVWHHSDFKNPALIETIETLLAPVGLLDSVTVGRWRDRYASFVEDAYSPTNVFALRFHWHAAREAVTGIAEEAAITRCLDRLHADQTAEGLFHDNAPSYPDAHDLTYHQYSLACLAQGLAWRDDPRARELLLHGVQLSLALTTPDGELAYVGRGAHNVYHVASAILAFETAATLFKDEDLPMAGRYRRAARLLFQQLSRWQHPNGMLPTAMNTYVEQRVGWNHCETPYNALVATLLLKASQIADDTVPECPLPMEAPDHAIVMNDSGYAAMSTGHAYAVIFGGCVESYAWSEGKHRTGVAGLAQFGITGNGSLLPILDHPTGDDAPPMTDLPVINGVAPYGRSSLSVVPGYLPTIFLRHSYGGVLLDRLYIFAQERLFVITRLQADKPGATWVANALLNLTVREDAGWTFRLENQQAVHVMGPEGYGLTARILYSERTDSSACALSSKQSNPRGLARWIGLGRIASVGTTDTSLSCYVLHARIAGIDGEPPSVAHRLSDATLLLEWPTDGIVVRLDQTPVIERC